jgi:hybrid cluster-associated redox disulfide protein
MDKITKDMKISDALKIDPERVGGLLMSFGMGCLGCAMASGETIEEACGVHGIDVDELMAALNKQS